MKILSPRNNKDYYDYLSGIYGIDEKVVYDRRQSTLLSTLDSPLFNFSQSNLDKPKVKDRFWEKVGKRYKWLTKYVPTQRYHCMLEVGLRWYIFEVERYLGELGNVCIDWKLIKTMRIKKSQRTSSQPITFFKACWIRYHGLWDGKHDFSDPQAIVKDEDAIPNPILKNTPIASLIPPQDIYDELSLYIASLNDIEIIDKRADEQKAEAAGFDRKTSFRNVK